MVTDNVINDMFQKLKQKLDDGFGRMDCRFNNLSSQINDMSNQVTNIGTKTPSSPYSMQHRYHGGVKNHTVAGSVPLRLQ